MKSVAAIGVLIFAASCPIPEGDIIVGPCEVNICPEGSTCYIVGVGDEQRNVCIKDGITPPSVKPPSPQPTSTPTPMPSETPTPAPSSTPTPIPSPTGDPTFGGNFPITWQQIKNREKVPEYVNEPAWVGVALLSQRPCTGNCKEDGYLGFICNFTTTPHEAAPRCGHTCYDENGSFNTTNCRQFCEQLPAVQDAADDITNHSLGPVIRMKHAAWGPDWQLIDKASNNTYNAHHKPRQGETGPTTIRASDRRWDFSDSRGREIIVDVTNSGCSVRRMLQIPGFKRPPVKWDAGER